MKLLLAKLYDERDEERRFYLSSPEQSLITAGVKEGFSSRIRQLFRSAIADPELSGIFSKSESLGLAPRVIAFAVSQLQEVSLSETDAKGAAFQAIVGPQVRGEKGQFFTPDPVKRLIVSIIDPTPEETLLDPACGSAGLLAQAIDHVKRKKADSGETPSDDRNENVRQCRSLPDAVRRYASRHVLGIEIDPTLVRVARLNMMLQGDGHSNIFAADALSSWPELSSASQGGLKPDSIDVVITNPPFGTKGKVDDPRILASFAHVAADRKRQVPDILFIERIVQLLKPGGRAGIVLPYGDFANSSLSYVREFLRSACHIFAVVSLPSPTFKPAENSVKAAVLFVRKWPSSKRLRRYPTFRAISRKIGYDMHERPVYRRDSHGSYLDRNNCPLSPEKAKEPLWLAAHGVIDEDISEILKEWETFRLRYGEDYLW